MKTSHTYRKAHPSFWKFSEKNGQDRYVVGGEKKRKKSIF